MTSGGAYSGKGQDLIGAWQSQTTHAHEPADSQHTWSQPTRGQSKRRRARELHTGRWPGVHAVPAGQGRSARLPGPTRPGPATAWLHRCCKVCRGVWWGLVGLWWGSGPTPTPTQPQGERAFGYSLVVPYPSSVSPQVRSPCTTASSALLSTSAVVMLREARELGWGLSPPKSC